MFDSPFFPHSVNEPTADNERSEDDIDSDDGDPAEKRRAWIIHVIVKHLDFPPSLTNTLKGPNFL